MIRTSFLKMITQTLKDALWMINKVPLLNQSPLLMVVWQGGHPQQDLALGGSYKQQRNQNKLERMVNNERNMN